MYSIPFSQADLPQSQRFLTLTTPHSALVVARTMMKTIKGKERREKGDDKDRITAPHTQLFVNLACPAATIQEDPRGFRGHQEAVSPTHEVARTRRRFFARMSF